MECTNQCVHLTYLMPWTLRWGRPRLRECHKLTPAEKWHLTARLQPFSPDSVASARRLMWALPIPQFLFWITLELAAHGSSNEGMVQPPTSGQMCLTNSHGILPWLIPELTLISAANCLETITQPGAQAGMLDIGWRPGSGVCVLTARLWVQDWQWTTQGGAMGSLRWLLPASWDRYLRIQASNIFSHLLKNYLNKHRSTMMTEG